MRGRPPPAQSPPAIPAVQAGWPRAIFPWQMQRATGTPSFILAPIGVSVGPGLKLFTRIRRCFRSLVQLRANDRMVALVAL
jgi:hypothetical protein